MNSDWPDHPPEGSRSIPAEFEALSRRDAELRRRISVSRSRLRQAEDDHADLLAERDALAEQRLALVGAWLIDLSRRAGDGEASWRSLERRVQTQKSQLNDVCEILRQLDDPYGFGSSLDDRIAEDAANRPSDEAGG